MATKKKAVKKTGFSTKKTGFRKSPPKKSAAGARGARREGAWRPAGKAAPARGKAAAASAAGSAARPARGKAPARGKPARGKAPARGAKPARGTKVPRAVEPVREARPARPRKPARAAAVLAPPMPPDVAAALAEAPGPAGAAAATVTEADDARPTALAIAHAALDKKAEDVTVLDVRGLTSYADYFVLVTADSDRQAGAIADHVEQEMKAKGVTKVGVEGYQGGRWILVDYGDVVAHVMNKESRGFYDLEGLWADAPRFRVDG